MIFGAKNESGVPTWKLVLSGKKTVTRRLTPLSVGKEFAVQPGRGMKAVCRTVVVSCVPHKTWLEKEYTNWMEHNGDCIGLLELEADREGFASWAGLKAWFFRKKISMNDTFRIEFVKKKGE